MASLTALLLGSVALAAYTKPKPTHPLNPLHNGKEVGELCVKTYSKNKTLRQCQVFVNGGCMAIHFTDIKNRKGCVANAMQRIKQLRPNMK